MNRLQKDFVPRVALAWALLIPTLAFAVGGESFPGTVTKGTDGDTIHFRKLDAKPREKDWKVRLVGIDSPEAHLPVTGGPPVGQQPWGDQASHYMDHLAPVGTTIDLVTFGYDVHHRVLGRIEIAGVDQNLKMIEGGWAIPYVICDGSTCDDQFFERQTVSKYLQACDVARSEGRGIFNPRNPLKEMPFEFRLRMQKRQPDKYVGNFDTKMLYRPNQYQKVDLCRRIFFPSAETAAALGFHAVD